MSIHTLLYNQLKSLGWPESLQDTTHGGMILVNQIYQCKVTSHTLMERCIEFHTAHPDMPKVTLYPEGKWVGNFLGALTEVKVEWVRYCSSV